MAALTTSCIDLKYQGNGTYSILKQLATMALQNGFITYLHQFLQTRRCAKRTPPVLVLVSLCRTVKAPALNNRSCYSPAKRRRSDWKASDGEDVNCWICPSACRKAAKRIRSKSSAHCVAMIHQDFIHQLQQGDADQVLAVKSNPPDKEVAMESSLRIVAITNCPAGIAHTGHSAAEALEDKPVRPYH